VLERQFRIYYEKASRQPGITGENLLRTLELPFRQRPRAPGLAASRRQPDSLILHGHWTINGRRVNIPSYQLRGDDVIADLIALHGHAGDPRRDRADRPGARLAAGRPRLAHGEGAPQARAAGDRRARCRSS